MIHLLPAALLAFARWSILIVSGDTCLRERKPVNRYDEEPMNDPG